MWTNEYPTKPGYYWVRNYRLTPYDELSLGPAIAEIHKGNTDLLCYLTGSGDFFTSCEMTAEWYGPIEPPAENEPVLEESECMLGGHAGGCRCHVGEPAKWQLGWAEPQQSKCRFPNCDKPTDDTSDHCAHHRAYMTLDWRTRPPVDK